MQTAPHSLLQPGAVMAADARSWDIFCQVIDNFGDIGVCWRLAADLAARGHQVRLWVDDASALHWMAPQGAAGVEVRLWTQPLALEGITPGDVLVEAFGCEVAPEFIAMYRQARGAGGRFGPKKPLWINLEYLSAEPYVERSHRMPSPVMAGPGAGATKWFFYPGFTPATGGLLREPDLLQRQTAFDRSAWRQAHAADKVSPSAPWVSLFCYEPPALGDALGQLAHATPPAHLLVTPGRAAAAVRALPTPPALSITWLAPCPQPAFDHLLWACDLNLVRGEDSLVRALWAGQPLVWHIYPQHDNAHHDKLDAFLDWLDAPPLLRRFHRVWNGVETGPLPCPDLPAWGEVVRAARARLLLQDDLVTQLLRFCAEKS